MEDTVAVIMLWIYADADVTMCIKHSSVDPVISHMHMLVLLTSSSCLGLLL